MDASSTGADTGPAVSGRGFVVLAGVLALVALAVSAYLSVQSLTGQAVAGCGGDEGCGAVLASPWSKLGPIPVSLLGSATYLAVLVGLGLRLGSHGQNKPGDFLLLATAPAMIAAAAWFTYIQVARIGEVCPYCMVDHGIGVVLGVLLPIIVLGKTTLKPVVPIALGAAGCLGMIGLQHFTLQEDTHSTTNLFADRDGDQVIDGKRHVSLFGGEVRFVLEDTPHLGDARAEQVVGLVFDYACPHCRATHLMIEEAIQADPSAFVVVPLPISIDEEHNPHIQSDNERFDDSYALATLAQAVAAVDMGKWRVFDKWLFSEQTVVDFPRSAEEARAKAVELIGRQALDAQLDGETHAAHQAAIDRNIALMALIPEDSRYIPVVTSPGAPRHLTERFYEIEVLERLLQEARAGLEAINAGNTNDASP